VVDVLGISRVRNCCRFVWMQEARSTRRVVFVRAYHCPACTGEMVRSAKLQRMTAVGSIPMNRVQDALARQRNELLDRWDRQLRAAAEAGFALDSRTAAVLPLLIEAADRALERRFRAVPGGTAPALAEARRAAMQSSLLGDFLFDAVLEKLPELDAAEQRLLGDALAHAAVEVLVEGALARESERRRRETTRMARLAHDLRNSVTATRLAVDLLRRRGADPGSRAWSLLDASLARLRDAMEDTLLDEALSAGGLRMANVRLASVLAHAHSAALELGAGDKNVTVLLQKPVTGLEVQADPRVVRPAVRGLLRAALQVARWGATIRVGAVAARDKARVAVEVNGCRKLRGNRLPDLPALAFARRAAKAHGGSLSTRVGRKDCEFRLALPRVQRH
jgi:signal transduction histidine kinase